jgi:hypothetical protein
MKDIRIANVPVKVTIGDSKISISRLDDQTELFQDRNFEYLSSNTGSEKLLKQEWNSSEIFTLSAKLPKNPFGEVAGVLTFTQDRLGFASEEVLFDTSSSQTKAPLNPNGYWVVSALKGAAKQDSGKFELSALITAYLNIDPSQAESQFGQLKDQIETNQDSWDFLAKSLGQSAPLEGIEETSSQQPSSMVKNQPQSAKWDDFDSSTATPTGQNFVDDSKRPKEKKKLFGKKKSESSSGTESKGSKEPTQAPQVDPDDPWA